jgi:hypothetical protein
MKKSNIQAELLSRPGQAPRHSPAHAHFFEQNYSADQGKLHATHLLTSIFFLFLLDYKHKHTADQEDHHATHLLTSIFFSFFLRLQAQARPR